MSDAQVRAFIKQYIEAFKGGFKESSVARQQRVDQLIGYVDQQIQSFLHGWQIQAVGALIAAQQPPEDSSKVFWYIALGGNLLWAGTCLVNPASGAIIIMSFGGAAIGSGSVEQAWNNPPEEPGDAKALAIEWIVQKRDELETMFKKRRREWATSLAGFEGWESVSRRTEDIIDGFEAYIWKQMFPRIPYDDHKYTAIHRSCVTNIESMLADFKTQWQKYVQMAAWYGGAQRKRYNIHFKYYPTVKFDLGTGKLTNVPGAASNATDIKFY